MGQYIYILLIVTAFVACERKKNNEKTTPANSGESTPAKKWYDAYNDSSMLNELSTKILSKGDTIAFLEMSSIYRLSGHENEFLYYAICMASDYQYPVAYYDAYLILDNYVQTDTNKSVKKLANYYLLRAYELGDKSAKRNIKSSFPQAIPNSEDYWLSVNK